RAAAAEFADRYRYFVVDEFQDVNPLQKLLLDAWTAGRDDVCVVGDPHQTIYSFTGATPAYLTGFTATFPHATVVRLVRNYRSTPQVVALANRLSGAVPGRRRRSRRRVCPFRCEGRNGFSGGPRCARRWGCCGLPPPHQPPPRLRPPPRSGTSCRGSA